MGKIIKVSGPLVVADGMADANMADVVRVGPQQLIGEILNMTGDRASIQVYEETSGLGPGADVVTTGAPLSVELGPGLIRVELSILLRQTDVIPDYIPGLVQVAVCIIRALHIQCRNVVAVNQHDGRFAAFPQRNDTLGERQYVQDCDRRLFAREVSCKGSAAQRQATSRNRYFA